MLNKFKQIIVNAKNSPKNLFKDYYVFEIEIYAQEEDRFYISEYTKKENIALTGATYYKIKANNYPFTEFYVVGHKYLNEIIINISYINRKGDEI